MAPKPPPIDPLDQVLARLEELAGSNEGLRKEVIELRSEIDEVRELKNRKSKNTPEVIHQGSSGLGVSEVLSIMQSTQKETVAMMTGIFKEVLSASQRSNAAFMEGVAFQKKNQEEIIGVLNEMDSAEQPEEGEKKIDVQEIIKALTQAVVTMKGQKLQPHPGGNGALHDGGLSGFETPPGGNQGGQAQPHPGSYPKENS